MDDELRRLRAQVAEKDAVIARIKQYVAPWMTDKRMRVMGGMFLREIEKAEREEREKTERGERGPKPSSTMLSRRRL